MRLAIFEGEIPAAPAGLPRVIEGLGKLLHRGPHLAGEVHCPSPGRPLHVAADHKSPPAVDVPMLANLIYGEAIVKQQRS